MKSPHTETAHQRGRCCWGSKGAADPSIETFQSCVGAQKRQRHGTMARRCIRKSQSKDTDVKQDDIEMIIKKRHRKKHVYPKLVL